MKKETIIIDVYEEGDRVLTPDGKATVLENEIISDTPTRSDLAYSEVKIQLDEGSSRIPNGKDTMEISNFIKIEG